MPVLQMIMSRLRADLGVCFDMDHGGFQPCQPIRDGETSAKSLTTLTHCSIQLLGKLTAEHLCKTENLTQLFRVLTSQFRADAPHCLPLPII
jgi:hypothetical protein